MTEREGHDHPPSIRVRKKNGQRRAGNAYVYPRQYTPTGPVYYWGDFRRFAAVGGKQEKLVRADGFDQFADEDEASVVYWARVKEYQQMDDDRRRGIVVRNPLLEDAIVQHMRRKRKRGKARDSTCDRDDDVWPHFRRHFPTARLEDISVDAIDQYVAVRLTEPGRGKGETVAVSTVLQELHSLSNLFKGAIKRRYVERNPVADMDSKPVLPRWPAEFLEVDEVASLLDAAVELDQETRIAKAAARLSRLAKDQRSRC